MLIQLSKRETKELELNSTRIENTLFNEKSFYSTEVINNAHQLLLSWEHTQGLDANSSEKVKTAKLSELLGYKPNYHMTTFVRNAVWGFRFGDINNKFLIYHSKRGLTLQIHPNFDGNEIENLYKILLLKLINYENIPDYMQFLLKSKPLAKNTKITIRNLF